MQNPNLKSYSLSEIPHYKVHGRTVPGVCPLPLFFTGSGIEVNVTGSELWIDIEVNYNQFDIWIVCEIDGALMSRQMLASGRQRLCLFRGVSPDYVKNVKVTRELQPMSDSDNCSLLVNGFCSDGNFHPVPDKKYTLEFVGDSITSGEGTYGAKGEPDWIPMYMSYSMGYPKLVSDVLDADTYIFSQGGWGVLCGWDNNPHSNIPAYYETLCGLCRGAVNEKMNAHKPYDFTARSVDAVIVNLGTNDISAFEQPAWHDPVTGESFKQRKNADGSYYAEDVLRFQNAVTAFLKMLRKDNPTAHIVWCCGMLGDELTPAIEAAVREYKEQTADGNAAVLQLPVTTEETIGSREHPGRKAHENVAEVLTTHLRKVLG